MGLTPEAKEALRESGIPESVSEDDYAGPVYDPSGAASAWFAGSAASSENIYLGDTEPQANTGYVDTPESGMGSGDAARPGAAGSVIDSHVPAERQTRREAREDRALNDPERRPATDKTGVPDKDEFLDFFSRIILRVGMESYVDLVFRGVNEDAVSDRDLERITPTKELRDQIAQPFAIYSTKNKWMRKHGREIVAAADSLEAAVELGIWMRRVNRIAKKYRPKRARPIIRPQRGGSSGNYGQGEGTPSGEEFQGSRNGRVDPTITIINPGSG